MKKLTVILSLIFLSGFFVSSDAQIFGNMMLNGANPDTVRSHMQSRIIQRRRINGNMMRNNFGEGMENRPARMMAGNGTGMNSMSFGSQFRPYFWIVNELPEMQKALLLTDDQVSKLIDLQTSLIKQNVDRKANLKKEELKLKSLLQNNASSKEVGDILKNLSDSGIAIGLAYYETANSMKGILNTSQKQKVDEFLKMHSSGNRSMMNN